MIVALATAPLHFTWQGAALGLATVALRPVLRRVEASTRYLVLLGLSCAAPMLVGATFLLSLGVTAPSSPSVGLALPSSPRWAQLVTAVWAAGVGGDRPESPLSADRRRGRGNAGTTRQQFG